MSPRRRSVALPPAGERRIRKLIAAAIAALFALMASVAVAAAVEDIRSYDTALTVEQNGNADVTETITVNAEGIKILHGIFRDIGKDQFLRPDGSLFSTKVKVVSVLRNGEPVPFRIEDRGGNLRVYMGDPESLLSPGIHAFAIRYRVSGVAISSAEGNAFAWRAIDPTWPFPIREASVSVILPEGASITHRTATIGVISDKRAGRWTATSANTAVFAATRTVGDTEGLVIDVGFDGGLLVPQKRDLSK